MNIETLIKANKLQSGIRTLELAAMTLESRIEAELRESLYRSGIDIKHIGKICFELSRSAKSLLDEQIKSLKAELEAL